MSAWRLYMHALGSDGWTHPEIVVVETNRAELMAVAADHDDTRPHRGENLVHDEIRKEEWAQMVRRKLTLISVRGKGIVDSHDTGIVDEQVDVWNIRPFIDRVGGSPNSSEGGEIELESTHLHRRVWVFCL